MAPFRNSAWAAAVLWVAGCANQEPPEPPKPDTGAVPAPPSYSVSTFAQAANCLETRGYKASGESDDGRVKITHYKRELLGGSLNAAIARSSGSQWVGCISITLRSNEKGATSKEMRTALWDGAYFDTFYLIGSQDDLDRAMDEMLKSPDSKTDHYAGQATTANGWKIDIEQNVFSPKHDDPRAFVAGRWVLLHLDEMEAMPPGMGD